MRINFTSFPKVKSLSVYHNNRVLQLGRQKLYIEYLSILPTRPIKADLLQQCMLHEYFYAGVSFIDKGRYEHFFGPSISAAKIVFHQERMNFVTDLEQYYVRNVDEVFEEMPDLEKPFFVVHMGWRKARQLELREGSAVRRAVHAEEKVRTLELEKEKAWKTRENRAQEHEEGRLRNLMDPKHIRKRKRQANKRKRKNK